MQMVQLVKKEGDENRLNYDGNHELGNFMMATMNMDYCENDNLPHLACRDFWACE